MEFIQNTLGGLSVLNHFCKHYADCILGVLCNNERTSKDLGKSIG